jgi:hypothetical protein
MGVTIVLQEKVAIPATWGPLLLQIEETAAAHHPMAAGNQLRRCLKIAVVDGYYV